MMKREGDGVHKYTVSMILLPCFAPHARQVRIVNRARVDTCTCSKFVCGAPPTRGAARIPGPLEVLLVEAQSEQVENLFILKWTNYRASVFLFC